MEAIQNNFQCTGDKGEKLLINMGQEISNSFYH